MLQSIREKTEGWIAGVILGLLVIPFALWGVNSYLETSGKVNVAKVDGHGISVDSYKIALDRQRRALEEMVGHAIDPRVFDSPQFKQEVLSGLIDRMLIERDAASLGYRVNNEELAALIRNAPQFQRNGQFDPQLYQLFVRDKGYGVPGFEERLRLQRIEQQIQAGIVDGAIVTPGDIASVVRLIDEKRTVLYATIKPEQFLAKVNVTPGDIQAYYSAHLEQYRTPEQVRIQYIELSAADIAKTIQPSPEDLRKAYQDNMGRYTTAEERRASHILIALPENATPAAAQKALAQAQDIRKQLVHGANFAELAKKYSADTVSAAKGGDLGFVARGSLEKSFEDALYSLTKPGDISEPVRTKFGYHIIKLTGIKAATTKPFSEVRSDVEARLRANEAVDRFYDQSDKFRNVIYEQSDSLAPAAKEFGLKVMESDWFSRAGGSGIAANPKVVKAAFDPDVLAQGHNSHGIDLQDNVVVALRVVGHRPAATKPLSAVHDGIEKQLKMQGAVIRAGLAAEAALKALGQGVAFNAEMRQQGATINGPVTITREQAHGLPPALVGALFGAAQPVAGKPVYGSADLGNDGIALFDLQQVEMGKPDAASEEVKAEAVRLLTARRGSDYFSSYLDSLQQKAKIKIYQNHL